MLDWILEPFEMVYMQKALLAIILISVMCAALGVYVVLRRMALVGDALAHTTLPGIVICHYKGWNILIGAFCADIVTALGIAWLSRKQQIKEDTAMGIFFSGMFALGIIMMSVLKSSADLKHILFGSIMGIESSDILLLSIVLIIILSVMSLFHKELELSSFDETYGHHIGIRPDFIRYVLLILIALCVVSCVRFVGVVLTSAMLVTPAATAGMLTKRLQPMIFYSIGLAVLSGISGLYLSYYLNWPSGASIVASGIILFIVVKLLSFIRHLMTQGNSDHRDAVCHD